MLTREAFVFAPFFYDETANFQLHWKCAAVEQRGEGFRKFTPDFKPVWG